VACDLGAIPAPDRPEHQRIARAVVLGRAQERHELPDGFRLRYPPDALLDLARWMDSDRRCCPFLTLTLRLTSSSIEIDLTGPAGTKDVLTAALASDQTGAPS
jgi:hypothetical protein